MVDWCNERCDLVELASFGLAALSLFVLWQTLRHMRISSEKQSRAYVAIKRGRIVRFTPPQAGSDTSVLVFLIELENVGQTPAHRLTADAMIFVAVEPNAKAWRIITIDFAEESLGPSHMRELENEVTPRTWQRLQDELKAMPEGKLFFFGRCEYLDVFGKRHFTDFCLQPPESWKSGECELLMSNSGNSAD
ncbi:hypothetical protein NKH73_28485 [Mesorhizobium sp. M0938]|uniref:hypothetical protein n=1 Tax=unclassified Mesorhizobium TaxID=325217 RepID=UPI003339A732